MLQFSDFPIPQSWPRFLPLDKVFEYLEMYCEKFDLKKHIKFRRVVELITQSENDKWTVTYSSISKKLPGKDVFNDDGHTRTSTNSSSSGSSFVNSTNTVNHAAVISQTQEKILSKKSSYAINFPRCVNNNGKYVNVTKSAEFDFVLICTGHYWKPNIPHFPGLENFKGTVIHSHKYKV
jgi:cation diffusion facilitator CzcD-associated flavoprotein CzcO